MDETDTWQKKIRFIPFRTALKRRCSGAGLLTWTTDSEEGLDGFNVYRSSSLDSGRAVDRQGLEKLNDALIGLQGVGAWYEFSDGTGNSSYDYWLEYVMEDGNTVMHPEAASDITPTSITLDALNSTPRTNYWLWALLPIGLTMLAGALMRRLRN